MKLLALLAGLLFAYIAWKLADVLAADWEREQ